MNHRCGNHLVPLVLALAVVAGCGNAGDNQTTPTTTPPTVDTIATPTTTGLAIASAVTAPAPLNNDSGSRQALRQDVPTVAGVTYSLNDVTGATVDIGITDPVGGRFGSIVPGMTEIGSSENGSAQLVDMFELSNLSAFTDGTVDLANLPSDGPTFAALLEQAPTDYLTWMAGRPGIAAGPVTDTLFAGRAAKTMTYDVSKVDGAVPCHGGDKRSCLTTITNSEAGFAYQDYEGTTVTLYQIDVAGLSLVVAVSELPGAAELADTITITEGTPSTGTAGAVALERTGPLAAGVSYFWDRSSIGTYQFVGDPAIKVGPFVPPVAHWVTLTHDDEEPCMSISDGTEDVIVVPDATGAHAGGPVTAQFMDFVTGTEHLEVVKPISTVSLGDVTAATIDVKFTGKFGGQLIGGGIGVGPDATVRIVVIPRDGSAAPDVAMVALGSPCKAVFDSLSLVLAD